MTQATDPNPEGCDMPTPLRLDATLRERVPGLLGRGITDRVKQLVKMEQVARRQAAQTATSATQAGFTYKRPANASRRRGRSFSTGGQFPSFLEWKLTETGVGFDAKGANRRVPYWIIQEIGTGESARVRHGGEKVRRGRPTREEASVSSPRIPSQRGRVIPSSLAFGTSEGGTYTPPGAAAGQQLYLRKRLSGPNLSVINQHPSQQHQLVISREIQGQHMVRDGGQQGFRQYRTSVLAAARQAFAGQRFKP
jgi:hypothetical protein